MDDLRASISRDDYARGVFIASLFTLTKCTTSLDDIRNAAAKDPLYNQLIQQIQDGFPSSRHATPPPLREFWEVRHRLSTLDGVAFLGQRTVIPSGMRKHMLEFLHSAHQGISGMTQFDCQPQRYSAVLYAGWFLIF